MKEESTGKAERNAVNRGLQEEEDRLQDPERRPPHRAADSDASEPERRVTPQEKADEDIAHLENPPQTEGPRERASQESTGEGAGS